jgi:hypothetical protein
MNSKAISDENYQLLGELSRLPRRPTNSDYFWAIIGKQKYLKEIKESVPKASWTGQRAIQCALVKYNYGESSPEGEMAGMELSTILGGLRAYDLIAISVALERGLPGLRELKEEKRSEENNYARRR